MNWIITIVVLLLIGFILDREIYFYEGTHLGSRVQSWLYDRWWWKLFDRVVAMKNGSSSPVGRRAKTV